MLSPSRVGAPCSTSGRAPTHNRCLAHHAGRRPRPSAGSVVCRASRLPEGFRSDLGVLSDLARPGEDDRSMLVERVSPESFRTKEPYIDGGAIAVSAVVFLLLTAVSMNRILGLDRFIDPLLLRLKEWREEERRKEINNERQALDRHWQQQAEGEADSGGGGPSQASGPTGTPGGPDKPEP